MPSTLPWASPQHGSYEVDTVFTRKRKAEEEGTAECMQESNMKRRCFDEEQGQGDHHMEDADMDVAPQQQFMESQHQTQEPVHKQQSWISQKVCSQYPEPRSPSPWPSHPNLQQQQQQPIQQQPRIQPPQEPSEGIMDINGETYGCVDGDSMDNDFVPDQTQYFSPQKQPGPGGDVVATTSELARSFCRPTWDGLTGVLRPYVNDYY